LILILGLGMMLTVFGCQLSTSGPVPTVATGATPTEIAASNTPSSPAVTPTEGSQSAPTASSFETVCGTGQTRLPDTPPRFADYATTILATLQAGSSVDAISQGLRAWGSITDKVGAVRASDDLTGDGKPDLLVIVQAPEDQFPGLGHPGADGLPSLPGDLYIINCAPGPVFNLLYADYSTPDRVTPRLMTVADINRNNLNEVAYTTTNCGASTCFTQLHVVEWNAPAQKFISIFPENNAAPYGKLEIKDADGDGISEIIQHVGMQGSAGAGIQRTFDETYAWNGSQYALKTRVVTSPQYPIHYLNDADAAFEKRDYAQAIELYLTVIADPNPLTFHGPDEIPALKAYARYRLILAYVAGGDEAKAQAIHDELINEFTNTPADSPAFGFARFAELFWSGYLGSHDTVAACQRVIDQAQAEPSPIDFINSFGYANRFYKPEDMCPVH
jgi:hypothetical protein